MRRISCRPGLAFGDAAAEQLKRLPEEGADEVGLQAPRLRALHLFPDRRDGVRVHALGGQLPLGHQAFDGADVHGVVHLLEQARLCLRRVAVADGVDQQVTQCLALEQLAQHVVHLAAQRRPRLFQLFQQAAVDLALAGVGGAEVPEVADLGLADAMDAAEALLQPVRVPGQVVVDHQVGAALQVHALAGGVVGDHHPHDRVGVEGGDGRAAGFARDAAVDHRPRPPDRRCGRRSCAAGTPACPSAR